MNIRRKFYLDKYGFDFNVKHVWYGLHWYWQEYPLFEIINRHRKSNSIHEYGFIVFGCWLYMKIDI